jgi:ribosomal protein L24E
MIYTCDYCGEKFERKPSSYSRVKSDKRFCSRKCRFAYRVEHENPRKVPLNYTVDGDVTIIHLTHKGKQYDSYIDTEDLEKVKNHRFSWKVFCVPSQTTQYITSSDIRLHRLIMGCPKGMVIDHIDGNGLNNRKSNLRICTHAQNCQNLHGANSRNITSGIRGVSWHKRDKRWRVRVARKHIGEYKDLETAKRVAIEARRKLLPFSAS